MSKVLKAVEVGRSVRMVQRCKVVRTILAEVRRSDEAWTTIFASAGSWLLSVAFEAGSVRVECSAMLTVFRPNQFLFGWVPLATESLLLPSRLKSLLKMPLGSLPSFGAFSLRLVTRGIAGLLPPPMRRSSLASKSCDCWRCM